MSKASKAGSRTNSHQSHRDLLVTGPLAEPLTTQATFEKWLGLSATGGIEQDILTEATEQMREEEHARFVACIDLLCATAGVDLAAMTEGERKVFWKMVTALVPAFQNYDQPGSYPVFRHLIAREGNPFGLKPVKGRGRPRASNQGSLPEELALEGQALFIAIRLEQEIKKQKPATKSELANELCPLPFFCGLHVETIKDRILEVERAMSGDTLTRPTALQHAYLTKVARTQHIQGS